VKTTGDVRLFASELKGGCRAERLQSLLEKLFVQGEMMKNVSTDCCSAGWGCDRPLPQCGCTGLGWAIETATFPSRLINLVFSPSY
jgi:hypothetical protein